MEELLKKLEILIGTIEKSQSSEGEEVKKNLATLMEEVKKAGLTDEDKTRLAKMEELEKEIKKQAETIDTLMKAGTTVPDTEENIKKEDSEINNFLKKGVETEYTRKAFSTTEGAVLIPAPRQHEIIKEILETSPVLRMGKRYTTSASTLQIPVKNAGTNNTAAQAEGAGAGSQSTLNYGKLELKVGKITDWVNVTSEMIDDSDFNVLAEVTENSKENIATYLSEKVWNGTISANNEIEGIYKSSVKAKAHPTATAQKMTWEDLKNMIYKLPKPIRAKSSFIVSTEALSEMRGFKDADGRPLYIEPLTAGEPGVFMGYKVEEDPYMDNMDASSADKFPVFFGDMSKFYAWLDRKGIYMEKDRKAGNDTYDFYTRMRIGGRVRQESQGILLKLKNA